MGTRYVLLALSSGSVSNLEKPSDHKSSGISSAGSPGMYSFCLRANAAVASASKKVRVLYRQGRLKSCPVLEDRIHKFLDFYDDASSTYCCNTIAERSSVMGILRVNIFNIGRT